MKIYCSIVIVTYNSASTIEMCLGSILRAGVENCEIIIVDNASTDETLGKIAEIIEYATTQIRPDLKDRITIVAMEKNTGYSKGCNIGAKKSIGEYIIFMNPDIAVFPGWNERLIDRFNAEQSVGAVGPISNMVSGMQSINAYSDQLQSFKTDKIEVENVAQEVFQVFNKISMISKSLIGFCLAVRKDVHDSLGGFDEDLILGNDDLDYSLSLQKNNHKMVIALDTFVYHIGQVSYKAGPKIQTRYLASQSGYVLGEKLNIYYGIGNVPSSMEIWNNPIFEKEIVLQVMDVVILRDISRRFDKSNVIEILSSIHFEFIAHFVGFLEDEAQLLIKAINKGQTIKFYKDVSACIEDLQKKFILISPDTVRPRKYAVSYMRGALDATGADIIIPDQGSLWDEEISSEISETDQIGKPILFLDRANLSKLKISDKRIESSNDLLAYLQEVAPSLKIVETKDARFRQHNPRQV